MRKAFIISCLILMGCGGAIGPAGPKGDTGASGLSIASGISCTKLDSGSGVSVYLQYLSIIYSTGDRYSSCGISNTIGEYTDVEFYKSGKVGATTGGCLPTGDIDAASGGYWSFTSQSGTTKATYVDGASAHNNYSYVFVSGDCTTF